MEQLCLQSTLLNPLYFITKEGFDKIHETTAYVSIKLSFDHIASVNLMMRCLLRRRGVELIPALDIFPSFFLIILLFRDANAADL